MNAPSRLVMAHRGASAEQTGNTIAAFQLAATLGADYIELDTRFTADRALVVLHDPTFDGGTVLCETNEVDLPEWLPTLRAALAACGESVINIEIKNRPYDPDYDPMFGIVEPIAQLVMELDLADQVLVSCFDPGVLARLAEVEPSIDRARLLLKEHFRPDGLARIADRGAVAVHPQDSMVDEAYVAAAHDLGLAVNVWTVDDPRRQIELYEIGVNAVCTSDPGQLLALLGRRE
ncbi:MAG: glycerophosphodiester phosphodiesterase [Acidimicrobiales bacterium]